MLKYSKFARIKRKIVLLNYRNFIGTKDFYKRVFKLMMPIMIQNGITNFVNMLDNVMVGRIGTVEMTGVAIANQLIFVFYLCLFGAISGAGIFGSQFYGKKDHEGVRNTFRFKLMFCLSLTVIGVGVFLLLGKRLVSLYLQGEGDVQDAEASLSFALRYIKIMVLGFVPYVLSQCYSSTMREIERPVMPMVAGVTAVLVNFVLNIVLIFGYLGAPKLGVVGAAIATVTSRFVELAIIAGYVHLKKDEAPFIVGAYKSMKIPMKLVKQITVTGMPLMVNETLWSAGMAMLSQCYSVRSLDVVAANNITQTFFNVFSVAFMAVGLSIGIIIGQMLGANEIDKVKRASYQMITLAVAVSVIVGAIFCICAQFIPSFYNTSPEIKALATKMMIVVGLFMPLDAFANAAYFTLRSGGQVFITILFDCGFTWGIAVPVAFIVSRYTSIPIVPMFAIVQGANFTKDILGFIFVKKGLWIKNLVAQNNE